MKPTYLLLSALLLPSPVMASDPWTKEEITVESIFMATVLIDWKQTLTIANNPDDYYEHNPILGKHPSRTAVNIYMPLGMLAHYFIADSLNHKWRRGFQYFTLGLQAKTITLNYQQGL